MSLDSVKAKLSTEEKKLEVKNEEKKSETKIEGKNQKQEPKKEGFIIDKNKMINFEKKKSQK